MELRKMLMETNLVRTMAPQMVFVNTDSVTLPGAYNEPLSLAGGTGGSIQPLLGVGINRRQQIS